MWRVDFYYWEGGLTRRSLRVHAVVVTVRAVLSLVEGELVLGFGIELSSLGAGDEPLSSICVSSRLVQSESMICTAIDVVLDE